MGVVDDPDDSEMVVERYLQLVTRRYRASIAAIRDMVERDELAIQAAQPISTKTIEKRREEIKAPSLIIDKLKELAADPLTELDSIDGNTLDKYYYEHELDSTICDGLGGSVVPQQSFTAAREEFLRYDFRAPSFDKISHFIAA